MFKIFLVVVAITGLLYAGFCLGKNGEHNNVPAVKDVHVSTN